MKNKQNYQMRYTQNHKIFQLNQQYYQRKYINNQMKKKNEAKIQKKLKDLFKIIDV